MTDDTESNDASRVEARVDEIVRSGPRGALAVAGIAVAIVVAMWFLFYFFAFVPRGNIH